MSLRKLSRLSGVKLTRLGDILRRGRPMSVGELEGIAQALGLVGWKVLREAGQEASPDNLVSLFDNQHYEDVDKENVSVAACTVEAYAADDPGIDVEAEQEGMMEEP